MESVTHRDLSLDSATVTDLARAFGRPTFFLSSARKTLASLRASIRSRRQYEEVPQADGGGMSEDEDEDEDRHEPQEEKNDDDDEEEEEEEEETIAGSGSSSLEASDAALTRCCSALRTVVGESAKILAGGEEEADELQRVFIESEFAGWETRLLENARTVLEATGMHSDVHRGVQAVFAESMENGALKIHGLGNEKAAARARADFASLKGSSALEGRKQRPSGKSHVPESTIDNAVNVLVGSCSTTAWSMRRHVIKGGSVASSAGGGGGKVGDGNEEIFLPALHRLMSKSEMFEEHLRQHPEKKGHLDRSAFFKVASRLSHTQERSLRALDYNITDLLHEPHERLKGVVADLGGESAEAMQLLEDLSLVYSTVQHLFPKLIGTTDAAPHNIKFAVGDESTSAGGGSCSTCSTIIRFFEGRLPEAVGGRVGSEHGEIVKHSLEKVLLYMGHSVRCAAQQKQIESLQASASGGVAVVTIDYMMKYEEARAREASREHYGKRGLVVHGAMVTTSVMAEL